MIEQILYFETNKKLLVDTLQVETNVINFTRMNNLQSMLFTMHKALVFGLLGEAKLRE